VAAKIRNALPQIKSDLNTIDNLESWKGVFVCCSTHGYAIVKTDHKINDDYIISVKI
jgi:hypothetical protein